MTLIKKTGWILLMVMIALQLIQPARNKSTQLLPSDISKLYVIPAPVQSALKNACYDCHSNYTSYPWYSKIQPVGWALASHIRRGKEQLNFSEFGNYSARRQRSKFFTIQKSIEDGTMPLTSYTLMHRHARLTNEQKAFITHWAETIRDSLVKINE